MAFQYGAPAAGYLAAANPAQVQPAQMQAHIEQQNNLNRQLKDFWEQQLIEVQSIGPGSSEFKTQQLPLTRIKKVARVHEECCQSF